MTDLSRRDFIKISTVAGVSLTVGVFLSGCEPEPSPTPPPEATSTPRPTTPPAPTSTPRPTDTPAPTATPEPSGLFQPNLYVTVDRSGTVTIRAFRSELGQGIRTAIAMIVAEELDADWSTVRVEQVPADPAYGDQVTGGSVSVSGHYNALRQAGAVARDVLRAAAAQMWGADKESCRTEGGWVIHPGGEQRLSYGELVATAIELPVPGTRDVPIKDPKDFRLIGQPLQLYDAPQIVDGSAIYASDVRLPGMLYATVARSPVFGGQVQSFDPAAARAVPGVRDVVEIKSGIAVVADNTWAAMQGRAALQVTWTDSAYGGWSSESIREEILQTAPKPGDAPARDSTTLDQAYDIPYLAHATMEPMNCVADVRADSCEVWAPSQAPQAAKRAVTSATGLLGNAVTVHVPLIGGAFGRRHATDFVAEAVQISMAVGAPVKLTWTRDDDLQHDLYHPLSYNYVSAKPDEAGYLTSLPRARSLYMPMGIPTGYWRSVENFPDAFARESFLDEVAVASGLDPFEMRMRLAPDRGRPVLELAASKAGWGSPLPERWGRGMAYYATFGVTHVVQVAEVSVAADGTIRVHRVVCAVDCGTVINPDTVAAQMEGGIAFGLTAALKASITIKDGRVEQSNFHDYPLLRIDEMPAVEVYILPSDRSPSGIGEMGVPPIAPAVANAIFAATGKRIRRLPIRPEDLREG